MTAGLIFPHQLFAESSLTEMADHLFLIEDHLFFTQYSFHKAKLMLHRASMRYYLQRLADDNYAAEYIEFTHADLDGVIQRLNQAGFNKILVTDPVDYLLERRLKRFCKQHELQLELLPSPNFITSKLDLNDRLKKNKTGYFMASFYQKQREALDILIDNGEPEGGQWSFDEENRKKLPKNIKLPNVLKFGENDHVKEAAEYVQEHFGDNPGDSENFIYPVTHEEAEQALDDFISNRFELFGDYEDAIAKKESFLYHSVLTPALNIGLLDPNGIVGHALQAYNNQEVAINSAEGFVRQIIGWREFMRGIYVREGVYERTNNHFNHSRKIPDSFYTGNTGIIPVDQTIRKLLKTGYTHHIERLMILGNFMLLCEFDPDGIYRWFMELYIDAYDWVMVPNVYGMTQYADGGLITTKPYISSSNYILKMSDYTKGSWCDVWDALYWRFVHVHQDEFGKNHRMAFMVSMLNKMDNEKLNSHLTLAEDYLQSLDDNKSLSQATLFD